jgi:hypothetical protein
VHRQSNICTETYTSGCTYVYRHRQLIAKASYSRPRVGKFCFACDWCHIPPHLAKAKQAAEVTRATSLVDRIESQMVRRERIARHAERAKEWIPAVAASREIRASLELLARISGQLQAGNVNVGIAIRHGLPDTPEGIDESVAEMPERDMGLREWVRELIARLERETNDVIV